jgi:hypothetical protein
MGNLTMVAITLQKSVKPVVGVLVTKVVSVTGNN